jgi:hypothetical protein
MAGAKVEREITSVVLALEIAAKWHKADVLKADPDVRLSA